jgi:hypothetical protein
MFPGKAVIVQGFLSPLPDHFSSFLELHQLQLGNDFLGLIRKSVDSVTPT